MKPLFLTSAFFAMTISIASAQPAVTGADLLVDLDQYIGKEVILMDVRVYGADNDGALAQSKGVTFKISNQGIDRETFRRFLTNCSSSTSCDGLRLLVTPNGQKTMDWPVLINVKIVPSNR